MKLIILFLLTFSSTHSFAASCCGGGFSIPSLLLGDDRSQITNTVSIGSVSDDVLSNGKWLRRKDGNSTTTYKLEGASLLSDKWQAGFLIPWIERSATGLEPSRGVGDISISVAHETFPELLYSKWKPKGVIFLQMTAPSSPSVYDSESSSSLSIRGRGFYALGLGLALTKSWRMFDSHFNMDLHRAIPREFNNESSGGKVEVTPGWGSTFNFGAGVNTERWRIGSMISINYEDAIRVTGALSSEGSAQKFYGVTLSSSYMFNDENSATLSFADQSVIGNPSNSTLSKTISLSLQHRWPR